MHTTSRDTACTRMHPGEPSGLAARHALPKEVIDGVTERAGGVPLFVEEVTQYAGGGP
jgi:hypothetical protein